MSWPTARLGDVAPARPGKQSKYSAEDNVLQITLDHIESDSGRLLTHNYAPVSQAGSSTHWFDNKHVLYSKLRPYLNKVYLPEETGLATTELVPMLVNEKVLDRNYLGYFLRSKSFLDWVSSQTAGAKMPRVSMEVFWNYEIPLPPLEEQKRIAAILDKADAIRRKRQQAIKLADEFLRAVFLDMFGDPVENTKGWEVKHLIDLSTKIHSGNTPSGGSAVYVEKGITFFRSQNVWKNNLVFEDIAYIDEKTHRGMSKSSLKNRDILMTKTGRINTENSSLGRAALYEGEDDTANINGHVYLIRLTDKSLCEFILFILTTKEYRDYIRSVCVGGIDKRQLNKEHLEEFPIILPPVELINKFLSIYRTINLKKKLSTQALEDSTKLFNGLNQNVVVNPSRTLC